MNGRAANRKQATGDSPALRTVRCGVLAALGVVLALGPGAARAAGDDTPRWASLGSDRVNMRVGPGQDYRVNWIYQRKGLPVKVLRTMGGWWLVEDPDGARGWVMARFVARAHTGIVRHRAAELRENPDGSGRLLWRAAPGVVGRLGACRDGFCRFEVGRQAGYAPQAAVWGAGAA